MKKFYLTFSGVVLAAFAMAQEGRIKGKVYDTYNNNPLAGAVIQMTGGQRTVTGKDGSFSFDCTGNEMELTVYYPSYDPYRQTVKQCNQAVSIGLSPTSNNLNEVEVSTSGAESNANLKQPQSIGLLTRKELNRNDGLFLENSINLLSGVRMEKRTVNGGQRITIRGYGNGTNFNGTGYKAYLNGIPITDAEGTTILDDVDFSTLGKVEVIKGPASSLYGTGIGGVLKLYTIKPYRKGTTVAQETMAGSYGLFSTNTRLESSSEKANIILNYGHQNFDGYRVHSASQKDFMTFNGTFEASDKQSVTLYSAYSNSFNGLAGQLDSASFTNKVNKGEQAYLDNNGHVAFESYRNGLAHSYTFSPYLQHVSSAYFSGYKQSQASAAGLNSNIVQNYGARTELNVSIPGNKIYAEGTIGSELNKTTAFRKTYSLNKGALVALTTDLEMAAMQYNIFTQWDVHFPMGFMLTLGASENFIEYGIRDRLTLTSLPAHKDQSGYKSFTPVLTPRVAVSKMLTPGISLYATMSQGYSAPTSGQVVIPYTGTVNTGLKPEKGTLVELGSKGSLLRKRLSYQLAVFSMNISDKLTSQAVTDTAGSVLYTFTTNAGKQENKGLELDIAYTLLGNARKIISLVRPFASFTYSDFKYKDFKSDNNNNAKTIDFTGNKVSGVAPVMLNAGLDIELKYGVYLYTTYQYVDKMPITYDNQHYAPGYSLLNAKLGYRTLIGKHFAFNVYAGGNNLTSSLYYNMVFLNANFSGAAPALYLPAAYTATFYGGLNLIYKL